jgi:hypothetical protein
VSQRSDSDVIEIKLSDSTHTVFYKDKAKVKDTREMDNLNRALRTKVGLVLVKSKDWFE